MVKHASGKCRDPKILTIYLNFNFNAKCCDEPVCYKFRGIGHGEADNMHLLSAGDNRASTVGEMYEILNA